MSWIKFSKWKCFFYKHFWIMIKIKATKTYPTERPLGDIYLFTCNRCAAHRWEFAEGDMI
jgi:hypothetical protein